MSRGEEEEDDDEEEGEMRERESDWDREREKENEWTNERERLFRPGRSPGTSSAGHFGPRYLTCATSWQPSSSTFFHSPSPPPSSFSVLFLPLIIFASSSSTFRHCCCCCAYMCVYTYASALQFACNLIPYSLLLIISIRLSFVSRRLAAPLPFAFRSAWLASSQTTSRLVERRRRRRQKLREMSEKLETTKEKALNFLFLLLSERERERVGEGGGRYNDEDVASLELAIYQSKKKKRRRNVISCKLATSTLISPLLIIKCTRVLCVYATWWRKYLETLFETFFSRTTAFHCSAVRRNTFQSCASALINDFRHSACCRVP